MAKYASWTVRATPESSNQDFIVEALVNGRRERVCSIDYADESEANAHLIAAAPELLEAVKELKQLLDLAVLCGVFPSPAANGPASKALAAIAKAEGRS